MSQRVKTTLVVWVSMLIATGMFLVVAKMTVRPDAPDVPMMLPALGIAGLASAVMSVVFPAVMLRKALLGLKVSINDVEEGAKERLFRDLPTTTRILRNPQQAVRDAWPAYNTSFIIGMALAESNAAFGLVLLMLGFPMFPSIMFFAVCWVLMLYHFPSEKRVLRAIEQAYGIEPGRPVS